MKAKVVYFTKSGNTKKIADAISEELNCTATTVSTPITEHIDTLFLGASVYNLGVDKSVLKFIDNLDPKLIGKAIVFSTSAIVDSGYSKLVQAFNNKNINVSEEHFHCKGSFLMMNKNHPNIDDENAAKKFARKFK